MFAGLSAASAACQTSLDLSGVALNGSVTLDVSSCGANVLAGLYTSQGVNTNNAFPLEASGANTASALSIVAKTLTASSGQAFLVTPNPGPGYNTFVSYTFTLVAAGSSASGSINLAYASQSCPNAFGTCGSGGVYGTSDTTYAVSIVNAPLLPSVSAVTPSVGTVIGGTAVTISGANLTGATAVTIGGVPLTDTAANLYPFDVSGGRNDSMNVVAPKTLDGPIRVTTAGGFAQIAGPSRTPQPLSLFTGIVASAGDGDPADPAQPSAVTGQAITLQGQGFTSSTLVQFQGVDDTGAAGTITRTGSASGDGRTLTITVPVLARSGAVTVPGSGATIRRRAGRRQACVCGGRSPTLVAWQPPVFWSAQ